MVLFKKIMTKIFWGLVLSVGYVFLVNFFIKIGENQKWYQLYIELCILGFFTGFISALSSKPFKATKVIYCSLIGIVGMQSVYLFRLAHFFIFNVIMLLPFFIFITFLLIAITIGVIDKSLGKIIVGSVGSLIALVLILTIWGLMQRQVFIPLMNDWYFSHPPLGGWGFDFGFRLILRQELFLNLWHPLNWIIAYFDIFIGGIFYALGIGVGDFFVRNKKK